jgi:hypothetical protein
VVDAARACVPDCERQRETKLVVGAWGGPRLESLLLAAELAAGMGEAPHVRTVADEQNEQYWTIAMVCCTLIVLRITYSFITFKRRYSPVQ